MIPRHILFARGALASRILAALFGGYALAALAGIAAAALPIQKAEAVLTGMMLTFLVHAGAVVWVFAVRSATRAWVGLIVATVPLVIAGWPWLRPMLESA